MVNKIKDSDILKEARRLLAKRKYYTLCAAITMALYELSDHDYTNLCRRCDALKAWIMHMLGGALYYENWLDRHHPNFKVDGRAVKSRYLPIGSEVLHPGRMAWLDWMIAECEKEEAQHG